MESTAEDLNDMDASNAGMVSAYCIQVYEQDILMWQIEAWEAPSSLKLYQTFRIFATQNSFDKNYFRLCVLVKLHENYARGSF